jgi:uncharacterized phiE125 gp8 family phage protein
MEPTTTTGLVRTLAPAFEPVTLAEAKAYMRVTHVAEDSLIADLIISAREQAEQYLNMTLPQQSYTLSLADNDACAIALPRSPVMSIASVTLLARDGSSGVLSADAYYLHADQRVVVFDVAPDAHRVDIAYVAGFATPSAIPKPIKLGLLAHITALYEGRGEAAAMPREALAFYAPFREVRV